MGQDRTPAQRDGSFVLSDNTKEPSLCAVCCVLYASVLLFVLSVSFCSFVLCLCSYSNYSIIILKLRR